MLFFAPGKRGRAVWPPAKVLHTGPAYASFPACFSIGSGLAKTTGEANEWEAADIVAMGRSARLSGGGRGMPTILNTVIQSAWGTVSISSGSYTRIITPDGLTREYYSAGTDYLPGVHLCVVIPLAIIADIQSALTAQA